MFLKTRLTIIITQKRKPLKFTKKGQLKQNRYKGQKIWRTVENEYKRERDRDRTREALPRMLSGS